MKGQRFKPGTVVLFFVIAVVGYMSYTLVSGNIQELGSSAEDEREVVMDCSTLELEFVDVSETREGVRVFFRSNDDLAGVGVGAESSNKTSTVEDVEKDRMYNATLNVSDYSGLYLETDRCPDPYYLQ